jgi:hypothetical protein
MRTVLSMLMLMAVLAVSTLATSADAQTRGCREGCPPGYVWDGCSCH